MKPKTRGGKQVPRLTDEEIQLRRALLRQCYSLRWKVKRLLNLGGRPIVLGVRVDDREVTVIYDVGVQHNPEMTLNPGGV